MVVVTNVDRKPVYLVTDVMNKRKLSDAKMAAIYRKRWGIEVYYRHCKQTFDRRKLRSHNPDNAMVELHWSLLGMWAMGLHSHSRLVARAFCQNKSALRAYGEPIVGRCENTRVLRIPANA
jgi:IS4 transposase